jgi:hypothetical protein
MMMLATQLFFCSAFHPFHRDSADRHLLFQRKEKDGRERIEKEMNEEKESMDERKNINKRRQIREGQTWWKGAHRGRGHHERESGQSQHATQHMTRASFVKLIQRPNASGMYTGIALHAHTACEGSYPALPISVTRSRKFLTESTI